MIVGKFFNEGTGYHKHGEKELSELFADDADGPPDRVATVEERTERLNFISLPVSVGCVWPWDTPPPHCARLSSA